MNESLAKQLHDLVSFKSGEDGEILTADKTGTPIWINENKLIKNQNQETPNNT